MDWLWGQSAASSTTVVDYTPAYVTAVVIAAAVTAFFGSKLYQHLKPKDRPFVSSPATNRLYLAQFPAASSGNPSPYCLKVEIYLKILGIEYEPVGSFFHTGNFSRGKVPVIQYHTEIVQESSQIIAFCEKKFGKQTDSDLSARDRAQATLLKHLAEDTLVPLMAYYRYVHAGGWAAWKQQMFVTMPIYMRPIAGFFARSGVKSGLRARGTLSMSEEEMLAQADEIFNAFEQQLTSTKGKFMLGDKFHTVDASVYGALASIISFPVPTPLQSRAHQHDKLISYCKHMQELGEQKRWQEKGSPKH